MVSVLSALRVRFGLSLPSSTPDILTKPLGIIKVGTFPSPISARGTSGDNGPKLWEICMVDLLRAVMTQRALENLHRNNELNLQTLALLVAREVGIKLTEDENGVLDI